MYWNRKEAERIVQEALREDLARAGDITSENLLTDSHQSEGVITAREQGILAGLEIVQLVFEHCSSEIFFKQLISDGQRVSPNIEIAELRGPTREILKGERTALNFLQRMSGIATRTDHYVKEVSEFPVRITDTRKTTPTLRMLEKYAVQVGGAFNHRFGLFDAVMIKDNHIAASGGITEAVEKITGKISHTTKIEVEVENLSEVKEALKAEADIIMLDNMELQKMRKAVDIIGDQAVIEASGGITLDGIKEIARTGVNVISIGALTHQINSLDISLNLKERTG